MSVYHGSDHILEMPVYHDSKHTNDDGCESYDTESIIVPVSGAAPLSKCSEAMRLRRLGEPIVCKGREVLATASLKS